MAKRKTNTPLISGTLDFADDPVVEIGARILREARLDRCTPAETVARVPRGYAALRVALEKHFPDLDPERYRRAVMDGARQLRLGEPGAYVRIKLARDHDLSAEDVELAIAAAADFRAGLVAS